MVLSFLISYTGKLNFVENKKKTDINSEIKIKTEINGWILILDIRINGTDHIFIKLCNSNTETEKILS